MKLSILIPTLPSRQEVLAKLLETLCHQIATCSGDVEVITLLEGKRISVGEKRNRLLSMAVGEYITYIDDDDWIEDYYISSLISLLRDHPGIDLITYNVQLNHIQPQRANRASQVLCNYDLKYAGKARTRGSLYLGPPAHTHVWRRELVKDIQFPDKQMGEDSHWAKKAGKRVVTSHNLDEVLYYYRFNIKTTETRN